MAKHDKNKRDQARRRGCAKLSAVNIGKGGAQTPTAGTGGTTSGGRSTGKSSAVTKAKSIASKSSVQTPSAKTMRGSDPFFKAKTKTGKKLIAPDPAERADDDEVSTRTRKRRKMKVLKGDAAVCDMPAPICGLKASDPMVAAEWHRHEVKILKNGEVEKLPIGSQCGFCGKVQDSLGLPWEEIVRKVAAEPLFRNTFILCRRLVAKVDRPQFNPSDVCILDRSGVECYIILVGLTPDQVVEVTQGEHTVESLGRKLQQLPAPDRTYYAGILVMDSPKIPKGVGIRYKYKYEVVGEKRQWHMMVEQCLQEEMGGQRFDTLMKPAKGEHKAIKVVRQVALKGLTIDDKVEVEEGDEDDEEARMRARRWWSYREPRGTLGASAGSKRRPGLIPTRRRTPTWRAAPATTEATPTSSASGLAVSRNRLR